MLDTNIFNRVLNDQLDIQAFASLGTFHITHLQEDELKQTANEQRKTDLLALFKRVEQHRVATESAVWNVSRWNEAKWTPEDSICGAIKTALKQDRGNLRDSLIAETCIKNGYILVTDDIDLRKVIMEFSGKAITLDELLAATKPLSSP